MEILASVGISHIRIPYGHWFFDVSEDEPYPAPPQNDDQGLRFYLKRMMGWADELDIKVLLDLHGAPGSQNGFDNSGKRGEIHFQDDDKPDRAARVLGQMSALMKEWIDQGVMRPETLAGIEFLNEPFGWFEPVWQVVREKFYYDGYEQIRRVFPDESVPIALQTGFRAFEEYDEYMQPPVSFYFMFLRFYVCPYVCSIQLLYQSSRKEKFFSENLHATISRNNATFLRNSLGFTWIFTNTNVLVIFGMV